MVQILLAHGADIDMTDGKSGRTSLFRAAESNQKAMVELLLRKGLWTPWHFDLFYYYCNCKLRSKNICYFWFFWNYLINKMDRLRVLFLTFQELISTKKKSYIFVESFCVLISWDITSWSINEKVYLNTYFLWIKNQKVIFYLRPTKINVCFPRPGNYIF